MAGRQADVDRDRSMDFGDLMEEFLFYDQKIENNRFYQEFLILLEDIRTKKVNQFEMNKFLQSVKEKYVTKDGKDGEEEMIEFLNFCCISDIEGEDLEVFDFDNPLIKDFKPDIVNLFTDAISNNSNFNLFRVAFNKEGYVDYGYLVGELLKNTKSKMIVFDFCDQADVDDMISIASKVKLSRYVRGVKNPNLLICRYIGNAKDDTQTRAVFPHFISKAESCIGELRARLIEDSGGFLTQMPERMAPEKVLNRLVLAKQTEEMSKKLIRKRVRQEYDLLEGDSNTSKRRKTNDGAEVLSADSLPDLPSKPFRVPRSTFKGPMDITDKEWPIDKNGLALRGASGRFWSAQRKGDEDKQSGGSSRS